jgi:regulator of protease activity HflC (stomatin/prohibitin superfamily)
VTKVTESSIRTIIGEYELEDILHDRQQMNERLRDSVQEAAKSWGLEVLRCEVNHIHPADSILEAMNQKVFHDIENKKQVSPRVMTSLMISPNLPTTTRPSRLHGSREKLN